MSSKKEIGFKVLFGCAGIILVLGFAYGLLYGTTRLICYGVGEVFHQHPPFWGVFALLLVSIVVGRWITYRAGTKKGEG